jgi:hypothetical protein
VRSRPAPGRVGATRSGTTPAITYRITMWAGTRHARVDTGSISDLLSAVPIDRAAITPQPNVIDWLSRRATPHAVLATPNHVSAPVPAPPTGPRIPR